MSKKTQLVEDISGTYDELPYASKPFPQTHPDSLRAVCSLFDMATPPAETANILEIGCSFGGNIIPIAQQYPKANVVGLDLSEKQISVGQTAVKAMGLKNIQLQQQDITTYKTPAKHFDYIICHGVYSWVPEPVKQAILRVVSEGLSDNGVAIVSYNTYPGWKISEVYRDTMLYRSQPVDNIRDKIKYGFGMLDFLKEHLPKESPWGVAIEQHYDKIRQADASYLAHEYFEIVNEPCYFHEFMSLAQEQGLNFVAEADFQNHFFPPVNLDNDSHQALKREANGDIIKLEQLSDFLSNRTFRQTILSRNPCPQTVTPNGKELSYNVLSELHIQGSFIKEKDEKSKEIRWKATATSHEQAFKDMPVTAFIFTQLNATEGQTIKVSKLWESVQKSKDKFDKATFFNTIAEIILSRAVKVRTAAVQWKVKTPDAPCVSAVNRKLLKWVADNPDTIGLATIFHESITLDVVADELLPILDGKHGKTDLYEQLIEAVVADRITFYDKNQQALNDAKAIKAAAKEHTERLLGVLQYSGLLG